MSNNSFDFSQMVICDYTPSVGEAVTMMMEIATLGAQVSTANNANSGTGTLDMCSYDDGISPSYW